jgi:hypothetical protein
MVTRKFLARRSFANDAEMIPFPKDDVTPPVTNIYFTDIVVIFTLRGYKVKSKKLSLQDIYKKV